MNLVQTVRNFFHSKYVAIYELITLSLLAQASKMVRKLIVLKGKNPDYVAPPPPPKEEPKLVTLDQATVARRVEKIRAANFSNRGYTDAWVKNPKLHPVLKARAEYENKANQPAVEPLQVAMAASEAATHDSLAESDEKATREFIDLFNLDEDGEGK